MAAAGDLGLRSLNIIYKCAQCAMATADSYAQMHSAGGVRVLHAGTNMKRSAPWELLCHTWDVRVFVSEPDCRYSCLAGGCLLAWRCYT